MREKAETANRAGAIAIICVGETKDEREAGKAEEVVIGQLSASVPDNASANTTIIAYEPVWAIGTGLTPTADDVAEIHAAIRKALVARFGDGGAHFNILYGGSVKPANASELMGLSLIHI